MRHVLLHCPKYERVDLITRLQSERIHEILTQPKSARAAARWFIWSRVLQQFWTAKDIDAEDTASFLPFQELERW